MLGVLRGRMPLGASVGQNPAVVFYVATMFTLIVLVMHVWLKKHSEESAARLAANHQPASRRRGGIKTNGTGDDTTNTPLVDSFPEVFAFYTRVPSKSNATAVVANVESAAHGAPFETTPDDRNSDDTPWFLKWFRKKPGPAEARKRLIKTRKLPEKVLSTRF